MFRKFFRRSPKLPVSAPRMLRFGSMRSRSPFAASIALMLALALLMPAAALADELVCNPTADYFLGEEDYGKAIAAHRRFLAAHPDDALAHYHLGFAYGMIGERTTELAEYRKAAALGLRQWDFNLNLGRAELESGDYAGATRAFQQTIALGPRHPEGYFNLGLAYERQGMFTDAIGALNSSLALNPKQPDAHNMLGLIYAEEGDYSHAREIWTQLARSAPDFAPARENLAILDRIERTDKIPSRRALRPLRTAFVAAPD